MHILNTIMKPRIVYVYYTSPFSIPNIKKLEKILIKVTKEIINLLKNTTNILAHLSDEDFGINTTSLLPNYANCTGKQLLQAFYDHGQLGIICQ